MECPSWMVVHSTCTEQFIYLFNFTSSLPAFLWLHCNMTDWNASRFVLCRLAGWLAGHTQWICQVLVVDGPPKAIYSDLNSSYRVQMHHKLTETSLWFDEGIILPAARVHPSIDIYLVMMIWCWCIPVKRCLFIGEIRNCLCNRPSLLSLPMFVKVSFGHTQNKISQVE